MDTTLWATRRAIRWILLVGLMLGTAGQAYSQEIVVTLLPEKTGVWTYQGTVPKQEDSNGSLKVTDSGAKGSDLKPLNKTISWLDFPASALPAGSDIAISKAQLVLARVYKEGIPGRAMAINVVPVDANDPKTFPPVDEGVVATIQSDPDARANSLYLADSASFFPSKAAEVGAKLTGQARHLVLLLEPTASASQRVYYGLNSHDPGLQPRLVVTYNYRNAGPTPKCTSEPAVLASVQADGRLADSSSCAFIAPADNPTREKYVGLVVAGDTWTKMPAVYRDRLYVVRKRDGKFFLDALTSLGAPAPGWKPIEVPRTDKDPIIKGDLMVVNRFGRLRIITQEAIFTCQLDSATPRLDKTSFTFGSAPTVVVPGQDGSLIVVAGSIFALNPDLRKLWQVSVDTSASTAITLAPDGRFVYALLKLSGKSQFLAINAQTGQNVAIDHFPDNLTEYQNPVAVHQAAGADYIAVTGRSDDQGVVWIVRNLPKGAAVDSLAVLTKRWDHTWKYAASGERGIGQPIPCSAQPDSRNLSTFGLCFVVASGGEAKMVSVPFAAESGTEPREEPLGPATGVEDPVVDSVGNVILWASNTLYGYTSKLGQSFKAKPEPLLPPNLQLLFGPGGTLYAVNDANNSVAVSALVPSFTLSAGVPTKIYSPSNLQVTGTAAAGQELRTRGGVILGNGFQVQSGSAFTVVVNATE